MWLLAEASLKPINCNFKPQGPQRTTLENVALLNCHYITCFPGREIANSIPILLSLTWNKWQRHISNSICIELNKVFWILFIGR